MKPFEIAPGIYNVGVKDWNIRDFHGYSTHEGSTYNAFLIVDEKVVLIDTVKDAFTGELIDNISQIIDPKKIDFVISNHTEMDHTGALTHIMHRIGKDKPVYCSKMGEKNLKDHFGDTLNYQPVDPASEMSLGKRTLQFIETRMLHWPDSMFTYVKEDKILISSDAFGQHYAGPENFDDEIGDDIMPHAEKYFANILLPFTDRIEKLIESITEMGLEINMICPDHGITWRKDPARIINAYAEWSKQAGKNRVIVIYDTMWHSTEKMANAIVTGILEEGVDAKPMHCRKWDRSEIMTQVMGARGVVIGSPTLNNNIFPALADIITYMKGLRPKNKLAAAFGSYGWSGEAVKDINAEFEKMKFDIIDQGLRIKYVPEKDNLEDCVAYGRKIAKAIKGELQEES
ncbi:MAG: MBL fold metallo-hydrolase [Deltaproteobacteria bacterium]|nr:MAG: MBL fold metallo-hydrolase [Deltaproteobacteria bacterium]